MTDTATRLSGLSPDAQRLYLRLINWWIGRGEFLWSRRDIHQRLRSGDRYRRVADLDAPLAALVEAGLIRRSVPLPLTRRRYGPIFALVNPEAQRARQRRGDVIVPAAAAPEEADHPRRLSDDEEVAWRALSFSRQYNAAGRVISTPARPDREPGDGECPSCGEPYELPAEPLCPFCMRAMCEAMQEARARGW